MLNISELSDWSNIGQGKISHLNINIKTEKVRESDFFCHVCGVLKQKVTFPLLSQLPEAWQRAAC